MKTWTHVERFLEGRHLPYKVDGGTLVSLDGRVLARTVQGVHDILSAPGHPDSKRQERCKRRDLAHYGARRLKAEGLYSCPPPGRWEIKARKKLILIRLRQEQWARAREVADRLLGRSHAF